MKDNHARHACLSLYLFLWMAVITVDMLCMHRSLHPSTWNQSKYDHDGYTTVQALFLTRQTQVMEICIFCMGGVEERQLFFFCFECIYVLFGQSVADTTAPPAIRKLSMRCLAAEAVQGAALALERVDDIHGGDGLPACVLGVGDGIADDSLKEDLEDATGLLVDEAGDALDTTTASETADGGLGCFLGCRHVWIM